MPLNGEIYIWGSFSCLCLEPIEPPLLFFPSSVLSIGSNSKCNFSDNVETKYEARVFRRGENWFEC